MESIQWISTVRTTNKLQTKNDKNFDSDFYAINDMKNFSIT